MVSQSLMLQQWIVALQDLKSVSEYGYVLIYTLVCVCGCACMCMYVISVCIRFWANTSVHISRKMIERRY